MCGERVMSNVFYMRLYCFSLTRVKSIGRMMRVRKMEVVNHPITTTASGFCISEPIPVVIIMGSNQRTDVNAVIKTGRSLRIAHWNTAC